MKNKRLVSAIMGAISLLLVPGIAVAGSATEWVQATVSEMQNTLPKESQGESLTQEQIDQISRLVGKSFNFQKLAQMVLGRHWKERTPKEREEFTSLFRQLLEQSHVLKMTTEAKAEQRFVGEQVEGDRAVVQAIAKVDDSEIPVEYILVRQNGAWQIYDLGIDGMRLSQIYRSQFNKVISKDSYAELIKRMRMKLEEIAMDQEMSASYSRVSSK